MHSAEHVHRWWVLRACRRNPLVRGSDRLELLIIALGILVAVVAAACAGSAGHGQCTMRTAACTSRRPRRGTP